MISRLVRICGLAIMVVPSMSACQTVPSAEMVPASLTSADESSMSALKTAAAEVLKRQNVKLGAMDILNSPNVSILPERSYSQPGGPFDQRDFAIPTQLVLMTDGTNCFLMKQDTQDIAQVNGVQCRALA